MKLFVTALATFLTALTANAYVLNIQGGAVRRWELTNPPFFVPTNSVNPTTHAIRYYLASDGFSATNTTAELNALRACFDQWTAISNTVIKFEEAGLINPPVDVNTDDATNVLYWVKNTTMVNGGLNNIAGALGVAFVSWVEPEYILVESDIVFNGHTNVNGNIFWFTDFNDPTTTANRTFVEGVALHEIGHLLGLAHSPMGGATMLSRGSSGVNLQAGLSEDDVAGAKFLYTTIRTNVGAISGTVTKSGNPVFGAAVFAETAVSNVVAGTVTQSDGTFEINMLPPGAYRVRVTPLDPAVAIRLVAGADIDNPTFVGADTAFLPTTNTAVTVTANATNNIQFSVSNAVPPFRITRLRVPNTSPSFSFGGNAVTMLVGQSNYFVGVGGLVTAFFPSNSATLTVTGDGITMGSSFYSTNITTPSSGTYNFVSAPISVSSNATPGFRSLVLTQFGTNVAYANGFLEIQRAVPDYNWDGLDDRFQRQYFPVFTSSNAAPNADPDGDRMLNWAEAGAGTVPTNAASLLAIQSVNRTNVANTVRWQSVNGKKYQLSYRTNVASGNWSNAGTVVTATGATAQQADTSATNTFRAYRVQVVP